MVLDRPLSTAIDARTLTLARWRASSASTLSPALPLRRPALPPPTSSPEVLMKVLGIVLGPHLEAPVGLGVGYNTADEGCLVDSSSRSRSTSTSTSIRSSVRWQERVDGRERVPQRAARLATAWLGLTQHHPSHIRCSCATSCASVTRTIGLVSCRMHLSKWQETRGQNALLGGLWGVNSGVYLGPSRKRRGAQIGWVPDVNSGYRMLTLGSGC